MALVSISVRGGGRRFLLGCEREGGGGMGEYGFKVHFHPVILLQTHLPPFHPGPPAL